MAFWKDVIWSSDCVTLEQLNNDPPGFPVIAQVSSGFYGQCSEESVYTDNVMLLHGWGVQERFVASSSNGLVISIPVDEGYFLKYKGKEMAKMKRPAIISTKELRVKSKLPFSAKFDSKRIMDVYRSSHPKEFGNLHVYALHYLQYLITSDISDAGVIHTDHLAVHPEFLDIEFYIAKSIKGCPDLLEGFIQVYKCETKGLIPFKNCPRQLLKIMAYDEALKSFSPHMMKRNEKSARFLPLPPVPHKIDKTDKMHHGHKCQGMTQLCDDPGHDPIRNLDIPIPPDSDPELQLSCESSGQSITPESSDSDYEEVPSPPPSPELKYLQPGEDVRPPKSTPSKWPTQCCEDYDDCFSTKNNTNEQAMPGLGAKLKNVSSSFSFKKISKVLRSRPVLLPRKEGSRKSQITFKGNQTSSYPGRHHRSNTDSTKFYFDTPVAAVQPVQGKLKHQAADAVPNRLEPICDKCGNKESDPAASEPENRPSVDVPLQKRLNSHSSQRSEIQNLADVPSDITSLDVAEIGACLRLLNMDDFIETFAEAQIDGCLLKVMTVEDFLDLGMKKFNAKKICHFLNGWRPRVDDS